QTTMPLISGANLQVTTAGFYILESNCSGCIKRDTFELGECFSNPCRRSEVRVEDLFADYDHHLRFFPNPAIEYVTVEWLTNPPRDATLQLVNASGQVLRTIAVPDGAPRVPVPVYDLSSGIYFIQVREGPRIYRAAKLIKE
ncbi:MAG: T9SS type A sorting domain-containing protein, partial [Lewinella sp.]|nr:T9SS type A sorting domain-containing protein [Lewinella sp.]